MSGLVIKLTPKERLLINGAVIENGDRRAKIAILTPNANILRLKDAIPPHEAITPVRRVCYIAQLALSGEVAVEEAKLQIESGVVQLSQVFQDHGSQEALKTAAKSVESADFYRALKSLRSLIAHENHLMQRQSA